MILSIVLRRSFRGRFKLLALVLVLAGDAACHSRGNRPKPRTGMDRLWCPADSVRMAYVLNRGPVAARLMIRRFDRSEPTKDLAVLQSRQAGEFIVPDSMVIFPFQPEAAMRVPRGWEQPPPPAGPLPRIEIEYSCH